MSLHLHVRMSSDLCVTQVQCGIRCLERNPGGDLLVASGCGPNDAAILSLPDCQPLLRLQVANP